MNSVHSLCENFKLTELAKLTKTPEAVSSSLAPPPSSQALSVNTAPQALRFKVQIHPFTT